MDPAKTAASFKARISPEVRALTGELIALRRHIHQNPEVAFQERKTAAFVESYLKQLRLPTRRMAETGVVALLDSGRPGPVILLRADMDALPVTEENTHSYVSRHPGVMHACGHDSHVAMLLVAAKVLTQAGLPRGCVKFCFQPGEEGADGGGAMVKAGVMQDPKVDFAFALHAWLPLDAPKIAVLDGPCMAAVAEFTITVEGVGGHAAYPHGSIDPVLAASSIVLNLNTIVSRNVNPLQSAVLTVASLQGGTAFNIIPPKVEMKGTVRTFDKETKKLVERRLKKCATGTAKALGCRATVEYRHMLNATVNDSRHAGRVREVARGIVGKRNVVDTEPSMGGEDFSRYGEVAPIVFVYLGARNEKKGIVYPHHHPKFDLDEDVLPAGVELFKQVALNFLAGKWVSRE